MLGIEFKFIEDLEGKTKIKITTFKRIFRTTNKITKTTDCILMSTVVPYEKLTITKNAYNRILDANNSMWIDEYLATLCDDTRVGDYGDDSTTGDDRDAFISFYVDDVDNDNCIINLQSFSIIYYVDSDNNKVNLLDPDECSAYE